MNKLLSFHGDPAIKAKYLERVKAHELADEIVKGQYWSGGKGCAVGCTIEGSKHNRYETELGIPEWLAHLEDTLFEGMANGAAKSFPRRFLEAIPIGVDLEPVKFRFLLSVLRGLPVLKEEAASAAIKHVVALLERSIGGEDVPRNEWKTARAAEAAAWAARAARAARAYEKIAEDLISLLSSAQIPEVQLA